MAFHQDLIKKAYTAFNTRDIDTVLLALHPAVQWANGWEGGYVNGHEEVRDYWIRQWKELNPRVEPVGFTQRPDGRIEVEVHQVVEDVHGNPLFDGLVKHVYTVRDGLLQKMDIEKPEA